MSKKETGNPTPKRKQANKSPVVVTRLNDDDLAALDRYALEHGVSRYEALRKAVRLFCASHAPRLRTKEAD